MYDIFDQVAFYVVVVVFAVFLGVPILYLLSKVVFMAWFSTAEFYARYRNAVQKKEKSDEDKSPVCHSAREEDC